MQQRTITILGGGFAGSMLAAQLAQLPGQRPGTVHVVEPRPVLGPGLAYTARRPEYLLNVRVPFLSAFPDRPVHFANWLRAAGETPDADGFCSRQTYGRYLQALTADMLRSPAPNGLTFHWHQQEAVAVEVAADGRAATVRLADGIVLPTEHVVLALGNFPPPPPAGNGPYLEHPGFHGNPWAPGALRTIGLDKDVLLIGSGLTAVDVLLGLRADGHRAPVTVVSRHGRWPASHGPLAQPHPSFYAAELCGLRTVGEVVAAMRRRVQQAIGRGEDWRPVFDAIRPDLGRIWAAWPATEQRRFLRHVASLWSVLRHRSPPRNATAINAMLATGQVQMRGGRVRAIEPDGDGLRVLVHTAAGPQWQRTRHVINCTGPLLDYHRINAPLVVGLRAAGHLVPDALHLGITTDEHGALLDVRGHASPVLFTLGPSRRPAYFESTAVPELRQQAVALAEELGRRWPAQA